MKERRLLSRILVAALALAAQAAPGLDSQPPLRSIASLSSPVASRAAEPVVLRAVVTLVRQSTLYVQDQTGALAVFPTEPPPLAVGDEVEIQGFYRRGEGTAPSVAEANVRRLWSGSPPIPLSLRTEQAAEGGFGYRLVEIEGQLLQTTQGQRHLRLTLEGDKQLFGASLEISSPLHPRADLLRKLEEGSTLRLTGVLATKTQQDDSAEGAFSLLLRSTDDIRVVHAAPWWNLRHAVWVGAGAIVLLFLVHRMRVRSLRQRFQAVAEERLRIAREIHDTMAQGFVGLNYQLEGLARELAAVPASASMQQSLGLALQLVRHSREEAHGSISALRSLTQEDPDLLRLLLQWAALAAAGRPVRIVSSQSGKPLPVSDEAANHLLRIGQEAIANALRHGSPGEIAIAVRHGVRHIEIEVADDGCGFTPDGSASPESGHFGILGMRERAGRIQAEFTIDSRPGEGTTVRVRAPVHGPSFWRRLLATLWPSRDPLW